MHTLSTEVKARMFQDTYPVVYCGLLVRRKDGTIMAANPQFYEMTGFTPANVVNVSLSSILHAGSESLEILNHNLMASSQISTYSCSESLVLPNGDLLPTVRTEVLIDAETPDEWFSISVIALALQEQCTRLTQKPWRNVVSAIKENKKEIGTILLVVGSVIASYFKERLGL